MDKPLFLLGIFRFFGAVGGLSMPLFGLVFCLGEPNSMTSIEESTSVVEQSCSFSVCPKWENSVRLECRENFGEMDYQEY